MNRHVGASISLSFITVCFFAVALYQPESPAQKASAGQPTVEAVARPPSTDGPPLPSPTVGEPLPPQEFETVATSESARVPAVASGPGVSSDRVRVEAVGVRRTALASSPGPVSLTKTVEAARPLPFRTAAQVPTMARARAKAALKEPFTLAIEGESLADVAVRVYGSTDAARGLWLANRDILSDRAAPLHAGMLLRTP